MAYKILIIDDKPNSVQAVIDSYRGDEAYEIFQSSTGLDGLRLAQAIQPLVVILDIHMEPMDGYEVMRRLQSDPRTMGIPVVIFSVTGLEDPDDEKRIRAIMMGAEHFLAKQKDLRQLRAIVANIARRNSITQTPCLEICVGDHILQILDVKCTQVKRDNLIIDLPRQLSELLCLLKEKHGQSVSAKEIAEKFYSKADAWSMKSAFRLIDRLRSKIEPNSHDPDFIVNVRSHGYKLAQSGEKRKLEGYSVPQS